MLSQSTFDEFAFPSARVRFVGPTDTRGSRYSASIYRDRERTYRAIVSYDDGLSAGQNALAAATACLAKSLVGNYSEVSADEYIAVPGNLSSDSYVFVFVPKYFFAESA